jgi:hypothetical protein
VNDFVRAKAIELSQAADAPPARNREQARTFCRIPLQEILGQLRVQGDHAISALIVGFT